MDRRRAAGALLALAACIACSTAAPTASNQTALELLEGPTEGCYYNFQHYGEGDRIMTNEPCLNCTCHNRMLMCYLRVCPFTKPIGQDCTIEKRADQCCPIVTCPDVPVDLLTSTSSSYLAEYGATGLGKVDKYGCSINGKYFPEGSKVPPTPNKPCEHCYCIRNMTTCVMQECTLHVDGCTPIYHKDVCCPVRYSCDHQEDEMLLLDDMTTTVRPTPGFMLTTTTMAAVTQVSQDCVHDDQIFADGALIKTEKACEHCYCMKGDIVCVVQECGTPMENEGKNCTSLPPRPGQCCPDTYICEGDELTSDVTSGTANEDLTTLSPPRRVEGSGYRNEPDEPYTEIPTFEGSGEEQVTPLEPSDTLTSQKQTPLVIDEIFAATEETLKPGLASVEPDKGLNTVPDDLDESTLEYHLPGHPTISHETITTAQPAFTESLKTDTIESKTTLSDYHGSTEASIIIAKDDASIVTTESVSESDTESIKITEINVQSEKTTATYDNEQLTTSNTYLVPSSSESSILEEQEDKLTTLQLTEISTESQLYESKITIADTTKSDSDYDKNYTDKQDQDMSVIPNKEEKATTSESTTQLLETTSINPGENEIDEDVLPILPPGRIPGEGDCLLNGITYKNNTNVPNINTCHSSCKCVSSIIKCDPIICSPPPEHIDNMSDCQPIYDTPDACCPTYVCHSRETMPPESHSQMSGTESPKPSSEKPEIECHGDQCQAHEATPLSPEPCTSEECQNKIETHVKDCKNDICVEHIETTSNAPSSVQPEGCTGDTCLSSEENCAEGKCIQPSTSEQICNDENGCRLSQEKPCDGHDCGTQTGTEISKPSCNGDSECESTISDESSQNAECTGESCRRKDQPQDENKPLPQCSGSNCPAKGDSATSTTESSVKDEFSTELTTEIINAVYSSSPETDDTTNVHESHEVTQSEVKLTEYQESTPELSTEKFKDVSAFDRDEHVEDIEESSTQQVDSHVTKTQVSVTEMTQSIPTKSDDQTTESIEHITKEMLTSVTQIQEQTTELPKKDIITAEIFTESTKTFDTSTNKVDASDMIEEHTQKLEVPTESPQVVVTTNEQAFTKEQDIPTESSEKFVTHLDEMIIKDQESITPEIEITKSELSVTVTEPSSTVYEVTTEKQIDDNIEKSDVSKPILIESTETSVSYSTEKSIPFEEPADEETKIEATVSSNISDESQKEQITENPEIFTEISSGTTVRDFDITEKESQTPQTIVSESLPDLGEVTQSSLEQDQKEHRQPEDHESVSHLQDKLTTLKEIQTYETTSPTIEDNLEKETESSIGIDKDETDLQQTYIKESPTTIVQEFDINESSTQYSEIIKTIIPEITTTEVSKVSSEILSQTEEQKYTENNYNEISTKTPQEIFQETTVHSESIVTEAQESAITTVDKEIQDDIISKPVEEVAIMETTISPILSGDEQLTILPESEPSKEHNEESTTGPEILSTKTDESMHEVTEKKVLELSTTKPTESETVTTESLTESDVELPEKIPIVSEPTNDQNLNKESSEDATTQFSEDDSHRTTTITPESDIIDDKKTILSPVDDTKDTSHAVPDLHKPEEHLPENEVTLPADYVTARIDDKEKETDSDEKILTSTEQSISHQTEDQNSYATLIIATQSQDEKIKLESVDTDKELYTTPSYNVEDEKKQTETPMSLITVAKEQLTTKQQTYFEEVTSEFIKDSTTLSPHVSLPDEPRPDVIESQKPSLESHEATTPGKEYDSKLTSQPYFENENVPVSASTIMTNEETTVIAINKEEEPTFSVSEDTKLDITTESSDKQAPTRKYPEDDTVSSKSDSDVIAHETTAIPSLVEESVNDIQDASTLSPETFGSVTATKEQESDILLQNKPVEEDSKEKSTQQPETNVEFTTIDSEIKHSTQEDQTVTTENIKQKEQDIKVIVPSDQDEQTMSPELVTSKYSEAPGIEQEKETDSYQPVKEEENTLAPDEYIPTEGHVEQPVTSKVELSSTEVFAAENGKTTIEYQDVTIMQEESMTSVPDVHLSTSEILTTESSKIETYEEDSRRTMPQGTEITQTEKYVTEKETIPSHDEITTKLPEDSKLTEHSETTEQILISLPEKESVPIDSVTEKGDYITPTVEAIEDELLLQTVPSQQDQNIPTVTEISEKQTTETQHTTGKPVDAGLGDTEDLQTKTPIQEITNEYDITEKSTIVDLAETPIETTPVQIPSEHVESETEMSILKEPSTESPAHIDKETSEPVETESSLPFETESPIQKETESSVQKETESPIQKETESSVQKETESPTQKETESPMQEETGSSIQIETESPTQEETGSSIQIETEAPIQKETESSIEKETESSVPIETEVAKVTDPSGSVEIKTETSLPKETEASIPIESETVKSVQESEPSVTIEIETEPSVPKQTESFGLTESEMFVPKETEGLGPVETETETSIPKATESVPMEVGTQVSIPKETESSVALETETDTSNLTDKLASVPIEPETETSGPIEVATLVPERSVTETSIPKETVTSIYLETESPVLKETITIKPTESELEDSSQKETQTEITVPEITEKSKLTETDSSGQIATETSPPKETDIINTEVTEPSVSTHTEVLLQKETESVPKDEKPLQHEEQPSTLEPIHSSSETTPYLVELEEHTNKIDDFSSVIPIGIYTTKGVETYQTERGDQPLDSVTDKSTQDFHEGQITYEDEKLTTMSQEPSEFPISTNAQEAIPPKTEVTLEDVSLSSESPLSTKSATEITEEQSSTVQPMISITSNEPTTVDFRIETSTDKKVPETETEKVTEQEITHKTTPPQDDLILATTKSTTVIGSDEITTQFPIVHDKFTKPEDKLPELYPPTTAPDLSKPSVSENQPTEEISSPDFPPSGTSGYGQEPDYVEEDQAFGPGTCRYGGKVYVSAQQIPRDDPCDFCFCFRSDIICLQQSCPPPIHGCHEEPIQGFCCPRYECPVSMATTLNVTTTTTTTTTTLPPHFLPHAYKGAAQRRGCQIKGHTYKVGDVVRASSGPCLHCTCGGDGQMKCDPKACTPEPMLRQMIAAAVSAKRRR